MIKSNLKGIDNVTLNILRTMYDQLHQNSTLLEIYEGMLEPFMYGCYNNTIKTSAEIQKIRLDIPSLRKIIFDTADFALYDLEKDDAPGVHNPDGEPVLYFGGREHNPIFSNFFEARRQVTNHHFYVPDAEDTLQVKESALRVKLADLNLQEDCPQSRHYSPYDYCRCYYGIDSSDYTVLSPAQRALAEEVHGKGKQFVDVMKMLAGNGIKTIEMYVLNPEYVKEHAQKQAICMRCCLTDWFIPTLYFSADVYNITDDEECTVLWKPRSPTICLMENSEGIFETTPIAVAYIDAILNKEKRILK